MLLSVFMRVLGLNDAIIVIMLSMSIFYLFAKMPRIQSKYFSKVICGIAQTTFGVYLIHENMLVRGVKSDLSLGESWLWEGIFHMKKMFFSSDYYGLYVIGCVLLVFAICVVIEFIRKFIFETMILDRIKVIDKISGKIDGLYKSFF